MPDNWVIVKLGEIVKVINGKNQKDVICPDGIYPIYGSGGIIGLSKEYLCEAGSTIIGRKGTINNPIFVNTNFWNVDTAFGMKPTDCLNDRYFYYFCQVFDFKSLDKGSTLPSLTKTSIEQIEIPLPPYIEQLRILERIDQYLNQLNFIMSQI